MRKIMYAISHKWGWLFAFISFIIALIFGVFPNISTIERIILLTFSCVIVLVFVISKIYTFSYIKVPRIVGCTVAQAKRVLKDNDLNLKFSDGLKPINEQDKIVIQKPEENCYVKKNSFISITTYKEKVGELSSLINLVEFEILSEIQMDDNGDLFNGDFTDKDIKYSNNSVYRGYYKDGIPNGKGIYRTEKEEYNGDFVNALPDGKGKFVEIKDDKLKAIFYDGDWSKGEVNGYGIHFGGEDTYEGNWKDWKRHGKGKLTYANGNEYDGYWEDSKKHGKGKFKWANGDIYDGDWTNGNRHGKGIFIWANGNKYDGYWKDGNKHGKGIYIYGRTKWRNVNMKAIGKMITNTEKEQ